MSSYRVKFTGTEEERKSQAWAAVQDYLGEAGMKHLTKCRNETKILDNESLKAVANMYCMFNGIRGHYPLTVVTEFFLGVREPTYPAAPIESAIHIINESVL